MIAPALQDLLAGCPQLQSDCTVTPTVVRQEHWVIVKNVISGAHIRLHRDLWSQVVQFDGKTSVQQWVEMHSPTFGDQRLFSVVIQLQRLGVLDKGCAEYPSETIGRPLLGRLNPLMLRLPLFNPSALLDAAYKATSGIAARMFFVVFSIVIFSALYSVTMNWSSVVGFWHSVESGTQFFYVILLYPLTKCLHELAHGLMLRRLGGQVPEAGISFIVLFPMPYVDVTDAWTLHRKSRMLVTAAGMMMDLFVASVGILLWVNLSSGAVANMGFSVALMCVVSILLFNANPLLKFDGYYLLEDAIDSPGLARRAQAYYRYLFKRYILVIHTSTPPVVARGERAWLLAYGAAGTAYRFIIAAIICVYLISTLHELGVLLSLFSLIPLCLLPLFRFFQFLFVAGELDTIRIRSIAITAVLILFIAGFLLAVPLPSSTRTQGVVWVEKQAEIYAAQTGQLERIFVKNGESVKQGQLLMSLGSMDLSRKLDKKLAMVRLAKLEVARYRQNNPNLAASALIKLRQAEAEVEHTRAQLDNLMVRAPVAGRVAMGIADIATGLHVPQGTRLAYVVDNHERVVRAVVDQAALGNVEAGVHEVRVRLAQNMTRILQASIARQVPSGSHQLPSAALINTGFDGFDVERSSGDEPVRTREKVFHLELVLEESGLKHETVPLGTRAYVTLQHENEPLARRWMRVSRQLLLKHLSV